MSDFKTISQVVPLPHVNLDGINSPLDGLIVAAPIDCARLFAAGSNCRHHYDALAAGSATGTLIQCPYGFASRVVRKGGVNLALTAIIPYPRLGGESERKVAKRNPSNKVTVDTIERAVETIRGALSFFDGLEKESLRRQSVALHEIRKLNRTVKQTAERLCSEQQPSQPDTADSALVQIWKCAELMSRQFDVIELLANEDLAKLPLNSESDVYRIFDKCVRIYNDAGRSKPIDLRARSGYSGRIRACDKTLPIIPSALIENAMKYSRPDTRIDITVAPEDGFCVVRVTNQTTTNVKLDSRVFEKGVRLSNDNDGTGTGLHLVKIVAQQHNGTIAVSTKPLGVSVSEVTFTLRIPEYSGVSARR